MFVRFLTIGKKKRGLAFPAVKQPNGVAGALTRGAGVQDRVNRSYRDEKRPIISDGFTPLGMFDVTNVIIFSEVVHLRRIFFDLRSERTRETTPAERAASRCPAIGDGATVVARDERNIGRKLDNLTEVKKAAPPFPLSNALPSIADALHVPHGGTEPLRVVYSDKNSRVAAAFIRFTKSLDVANVIIFSKIVHLRRIFFDLRSERTRETTPAERAASRCPAIGDGATVVARDERNIGRKLDNLTEVKKAAPPFPLSNALPSIADALHVPHGGTEPLRVVYSDENSRDAAAFIRLVKSLDVANVIIFSKVVHVGRYFFAFFVLRPSVASSAAVSAGANRSPCTAARFPSKR